MSLKSVFFGVFLKEFEVWCCLFEGRSFGSGNFSVEEAILRYEVDNLTIYLIDLFIEKFMAFSSLFWSYYWILTCYEVITSDLDTSWPLRLKVSSFIKSWPSSKP